jgi:hypothetical protein
MHSIPFDYMIGSSQDALLTLAYVCFSAIEKLFLINHFLPSLMINVMLYIVLFLY